VTADLAPERIRRLHMGHFTRPKEEPGGLRKVVASAFLIDHPAGLILFDTGIGAGHQEADRIYTPAPRPLPVALRSAGVRTDDIRIVANCHLHLDHCGGNPLFPRIPIFSQGIEYEMARGNVDYTLPSLVEFEGAAYELHEGQADVAPGVRLMPTPGHVAGHQSMIVDTARGPVVLAGQAFDSASDFATSLLTLRLGPDDPGGSPEVPEAARVFAELDPFAVLFAHDLVEWQRPTDRTIGWAEESMERLELG
jgi:glyoxylase-like metal-dependent hydrolase (beta-lactamase superfamily II)